VKLPTARTKEVTLPAKLEGLFKQNLRDKIFGKICRTIPYRFTGSAGWPSQGKKLSSLRSVLAFLVRALSSRFFFSTLLSVTDAGSAAL
jgi:hypothetical protein